MKDNFKNDTITHCTGCNCMTKTIWTGRAKAHCGKCKHDKVLGDLYQSELEDREMKHRVLSAVERMPENRCLMIPDGGRGSWFKSDIVEAIEEETEMGEFFVEIFSRAIKLKGMTNDEYREWAKKEDEKK